ncbi:cytochrome b [Acinetobacter sp.]|jgi:cytochrome b561|uniref:cytochrome b n=1 Tax=Acinetobacter sp. TaxID=472 RepID=UPI0035B23D4F
MTASNKKFPQVVIFAHWATLLFVLAAYFSSQSPIEGGWRGQMHVIAGSLVFIFFFIRIFLYMRFKDQFPEVSFMSGMQKRAFQLMKLFLYTGLFAVPLLGWLTLSSTEASFSLFGMGLPEVLFSSNADLGDIHPLIANIFMTLIGLHALAALIHHFILKDDVLKSMR